MRLDFPPAASARLPWLDAARGAAIGAMAVYHFSWDLRYFGYITADVTGDFGWRLFARAIAASFLFIVGVSLVLASRKGLNRARYLRRLGAVVAAAAAITVVTYFLFPDSYIFFGILHHIAVASVLGLAFVGAPLLIVVAAAVASLFAPSLLAGPAFDNPALFWLGLGSYAPRTNDFVPLFPWFGVVLAGIVVARLAPLVPQRLRLNSAGAWMPRPLLWAGRNSLIVYLLHQPILFGIVFLVAQVSPPSLLALEPRFIESCRIGCIEPAGKSGTCARACACVAHQLQEEDLWRGVMRMELTLEQETRYHDIADQCRAEAISEPGG